MEKCCRTEKGFRCFKVQQMAYYDLYIQTSLLSTFIFDGNVSIFQKHWKNVLKYNLLFRVQRKKSILFHLTSQMKKQTMLADTKIYSPTCAKKKCNCKYLCGMTEVQ